VLCHPALAEMEKRAAQSWWVEGSGSEHGVIWIDVTQFCPTICVVEVCKTFLKIMLQSLMSCTGASSI